jgi:hypothetical protein
MSEDEKEITTKIEHLPIDIKKAIKDAMKNRLVFSNSEKVINDIEILYMLNRANSQLTLSISSKFLVSSFALEFLKVLGDIIKRRYNIQLTLEEFKNKECRDKLEIKISELKKETLIEWSTECLENLKDVVDNININDLNDIITLGHIIDLTKEELLRVANKIEIVEIYDILYRYINRLDNLKLKTVKFGNIKKMEFKFEETIIEKDKKSYKCINFICE